MPWLDIFPRVTNTHQLLLRSASTTHPLQTAYDGRNDERNTTPTHVSYDRGWLVAAVLRVDAESTTDRRFRVSHGT